MVDDRWGRMEVMQIGEVHMVGIEKADTSTTDGGVEAVAEYNSSKPSSNRI